MKRFLLFVIFVALFVAGLYRWTERRSPAPTREPFTPASEHLDLKNLQVLAALDAEYTRLVSAVVPSVVSITTSKSVRTGYVIDPYEFFFHRRLRGIPQEQKQTALGSGVIVSREGHILTNNHVVADMETIEVQLSDGRAARAQVIGSDEKIDLAVLKIKLDRLKPLPIGDSDGVQVGQLAFAVGNPLGLQESVTRGIISAERRGGQDGELEYFQTDAAINPGNSGGPLINGRGEIIGINTWIASQTGGSQGLGFAVPSNLARRAMESILKHGRVVRGYLGVVIQPLTPELAQQFGVEEAGGALVTEVTPDSPAQRAGIRRGDVIKKFNGRAIRTIQELRGRVAEIEVGTKFSIVVLRGKQEVALTAEIAEQPAGAAAAPPSAAPDATGQATGQNALAGLRVSEIPDGAYAQLPANIQGVIVAAIEPGAPAARVLQPGDVIEEINRQPVASVADFQKIAQAIPAGDRLMLFICRGKVRSFVVIAP
jgi:serine protease Do